MLCDAVVVLNIVASGWHYKRAGAEKFETTSNGSEIRSSRYMADFLSGTDVKSETQSGALVKMAQVASSRPSDLRHAYGSGSFKLRDSQAGYAQRSIDLDSLVWSMHSDPSRVFAKL